MAKSVKPGGELKRSPIHLLHRALQLSLDFYQQEAGDLGVTQRQYAVLCAVAADDGLSQTQLVRATGIDRSTIAELVARMAGLGLVARQRASGDGRTNMVRLTEHGREVLDLAAPKVAKADRRLLKLLSGKKRDALVELLQEVVKAAGSASDEEAAPAKKKAAKPKVETPEAI